MVNILFWLFVLAFDLLLPVVMIFFGREFMKNPPKEINPGYGYRTAMSSKNQDTWDFAQRKMGEVWYKSRAGAGFGYGGHCGSGNLPLAADSHAGLCRGGGVGAEEKLRQTRKKKDRNGLIL